MIGGQNSIDEPVKNDLRPYVNNPKIAIVQGDDNTTGCLLDYKCFNNYYKKIVIDLRRK